MVCPRCGLWNPQRNATCESCGEPLHATAPPNTAPPITSQGTAAAFADIFPAAIPGFAPPASEPRAVQATPLNSRPRANEPSVYAPVLGPADRESFFAAQRRHRRATWKLTAGSAVAAIITGIPLSLVLTPIIFAVILILTRLVHIVVPVPDVVWDTYRSVGFVLADVLEATDDPATPYIEETDFSRVPISLFIKAGIVWLLPGIILMLIMWPILIQLFRRGGVGGVLLSLGAREPVMTDLEERQLVNVVEEMAIAAGLPQPRVRLIDASVANAAAVGSSPEDATIVVSRALLDDLDRDETQGVLAHLVASVGNGDLRGAMSIVAIFQTFGFAAALVKAPISGPARKTVWRMFRYVFSFKKPNERAEEAHIISEMLTSGIWENDEDDFSDMDDGEEVFERPGPSIRWLLYFPLLFIIVFIATLLLEFSDALRRLSLFGVFVLAGLIVYYQRRYVAWALPRALKMARLMVMLPYYMAATLPQLMIGMMTGFMLEPLLAVLWRTRRYLADATAVQLTRQPDWIAKGLTGLISRGAIIPGGKWAGPLFIVGPRVGSGFTAASGGSVVSFHPPLDKRLEKLRRMGASLPEAEPAAQRPHIRMRDNAKVHPLVRIFIVPIIGLLSVIVAVLMVVALALMGLLAFGACAILMMVVYGLFMLLAPA